MAITIMFRGGALAGQKHEFGDDVETIVIGRDPDKCQLVLPADLTQVGRQHTALKQVTGRYRVVVNRDNPVYVDGELAVDGMELPALATVELGKDGPKFVAKTELGDTVLATVRGEEGAGPGIGTRLRRSERRSKTNFKALSLVGLLVVALGVGGYLIFRDVDEKLDRVTEIANDMEGKVESELQNYEKELSTLKGTLGADREKLARLVVEREKRAALLDKLRKRQDIDKAERRRLEDRFEQKLKAADRKLHDLNKSIVAQSGQRKDWAKLAEKYEAGLFLIVADTVLRGTDGKLRTTFDGKPRLSSRAIGTAFCIRRDGLLATNAHVVMFLEDKWDSTRAYQSGTGKAFHIGKFSRHPGWDPNRVGGPDVGLIQLVDPQPGSSTPNDLPVLALASEADLRNLKVGTELGTIGFPGEFLEDYVGAGAPATANKANATFKNGFVGRIMDYKNQRGGFATDHYIQHSALLTQGCSGSPLFMLDGKVVGIHHAARIVVTLKPVSDGAGGTKLTPKKTASPAAIQFGVRIDELVDFMKGLR